MKKRQIRIDISDEEGNMGAQKVSHRIDREIIVLLDIYMEQIAKEGAEMYRSDVVHDAIKAFLKKQGLRVAGKVNKTDGTVKVDIPDRFIEVARQYQNEP